jgi:hypothetical protein
MVTRSVKEAQRYIATQIQHGTQFRSGLCKRKTREAYNIPSDGTADAAGAWAKTRHRFRGAWIWGGLIYWTGGSEGHGHVGVMRWRKGRIRSVDYPRSGRWNNTTVAELEAAWPALRFAGTALDIDGVTVRRMPRVIRRWSHP